MKRFLLITMAGTAALVLYLFYENRKELEEQAERFDALRPRHGGMVADEPEE